MKQSWVKGLNIAEKTLGAWFADAKVKWFEVQDGTLASAGSDVFGRALLDLQLDFACKRANDDTLLHVLVRSRKLPPLITLFALVKEQLAGKSNSMNLFVNGLTSNQWNELLMSKDSDHLSFLDIALIRRYMDIYSILKGYVGENIHVEIRVPRYKVEVLEEITCYEHSQKDKLSLLAELVSDKDEVGKAEEERESINQSLPREDKEGGHQADQPVVCLSTHEVNRQFKLDKNSADLHTLSTYSPVCLLKLNSKQPLRVPLTR